MPESGTRSVVFVCWGNICRSPMAERVAEKLAAERGLDDVVFTSAATSREEIGAPIDDRAVEVLRRHGYRTGEHAAHQITRAEIESADLVLAMENIHLTKMLAIAPERGQPAAADRLRSRGPARATASTTPGTAPMRASSGPWPRSKPPSRVCSTTSRPELAPEVRDLSGS